MSFSFQFKHLNSETKKNNKGFRTVKRVDRIELIVKKITFFTMVCTK